MDNAKIELLAGQLTEAYHGLGGDGNRNLNQVAIIKKILELFFETVREELEELKPIRQRLSEAGIVVK